MKLSVRTGYQGVDGGAARSKRNLTAGQLSRQYDNVNLGNTVNLGWLAPSLEQRIRETAFFKNFQNFPTHKTKSPRRDSLSFLIFSTNQFQYCFQILYIRM